VRWDLCRQQLRLRSSRTVVVVSKCWASGGCRRTGGLTPSGMQERMRPTQTQQQQQGVLLEVTTIRMLCCAGC
jgi:hypothetical protein